MAQQRYPGAQPFQADQEEIFFGRATDVATLRRKIKLATITVLYGKSGLGKSSLVNAGLLPVLRPARTTEAVRIRFGAYQPATDATEPLTPAAHCREAIRQTSAATTTYLEKLLPADDSIWRATKEQAARQTNERELLLIFDQFEELFSYPAAAIAAFKRQLAEAIHTAVPQRYWDVLESGYGAATDLLRNEETNLLQAAPAVKVLFVVRSDRLHLLEKLSDFLPEILRNCQELHPLDLGQAREAIVVPASLEGDYTIPPFTYVPDAVNDILDFLTQSGTEPIESTQLQIICHSLAQKVTAAGRHEVETADTQNLAAIIENYYADRIDQIPDAIERLAARKLIEEGLIFAEEERRLSLYEGQVLKQVSATTLRLLTDGHLLRAEPSLRGGYTYELSHDTLVAPILKARAERLTAERQATAAARERERAAERAAERRKRRIAYGIAAAGLLLATLATVMAFLAYRAQQEIRRQSFAQQFEAARRLKLEGLYTTAVAELDTLVPLAERLGTDRLQMLRDTQTVYREVSTIVARAESRLDADSLRFVLDDYRRAAGLSGDARLEGLIETTQIRLRDRVEDRTADYQNFLREDQLDLASQVRARLLLLDPDLGPALDSLRRNYVQ